MWQEYKWWMEGGIFNFLSQSWLLYPKFMRLIGPDGSVSAVTVTVCTSIFQAIFNGTCQLIYLLVFPGIDMERRWGLLFSVFSPPLIIVPREASEEGTVGPLVKGSMMGVGPSLELLVNHSISVTWFGASCPLPAPAPAWRRDFSPCADSCLRLHSGTADSFTAAAGRTNQDQ